MSRKQASGNIDLKNVQSNEDLESEEVLAEMEDDAEGGAEEDCRADSDKTAEGLAEELEALRNKYLRLHADYDNYRKRVGKDLSNARLNAQTDAVAPIIQIFDHFDMAVAAADKADNMEAIREGMRLILMEFDKAMDELGLRKIDAVGKPFDPNLHEAVAEEPSEAEEGVVIKQWRCGYRMGDRVIRPANVVVSSGPGGEAD